MLATGLLVDRLRRIEKRTSRLEARYRNMKGDLNDLMEEHVVDDDTGHYMNHEEAGDLIDSGDVTEEPEEGESTSEEESESEESSD